MNNIKRATCARMRETGERYTVARMRVLEQYCRDHGRCPQCRTDLTRYDHRLDCSVRAMPGEVS